MFKDDWGIVKAAHEGLEDYLLSSELYQIAAGVRLSPGNLLLSIARLSAIETHRNELKPYLESIEKVRIKWRSAWKTKASKEFDERVRLWSQFIKDIQGEGEIAQTEYNNRVRVRVLLSLMVDDIGITPRDEVTLFKLDEILRSFSSPSTFVWENEIKSVFPEGPFWFLYRAINVSHK